MGWWASTDEKANTLGSAEFLAEYKKVFDANKKAINAYVFGLLKREEKGLKGFEKMKGILVEGDLDGQLAGFTEANECTTPTFKLRRPFLLRRYIKGLKDLYGANGEPCNEDEHWPGEAASPQKTEEKAPAKQVD